MKTYLLKEVNTSRYVFKESKANLDKGAITINSNDWKCYKVINVK